MALTGGVNKFPPVGFTLFSVGAGVEPGEVVVSVVVVVVVVVVVSGVWSPSFEQLEAAKLSSTTTAPPAPTVQYRCVDFMSCSQSFEWLR